MSKLQLITGEDRSALGRACPELGLDAAQVEALKSIDPKDRLAAFSFMEFCRGQKFEDGIQAKMAAKMGFIQGFNVGSLIHSIEKTDLEKVLREL